MHGYKYYAALRRLSRPFGVSKCIYGDMLCPDALCFLNAMFPLWPSFYKPPQDIVDKWRDTPSDDVSSTQSYS